MQLFTNLNERTISNGLPFGIIFIAGNSDNPIDIDDKTKKLESCFRDASKHPFHCPFTIGNYLMLDNLKSCFIFQNDRPFNLKQYLLGLKEKLGFELTGIFYCENANTHKIELIGNDSDFREVLLEFSENIPKAPNEIPQFLTNFKNSKIPNGKISSFLPPIKFASNKNSPSISSYELLYKYFQKKVRDTFDRYLWHGYSKIPQEKRIAKIKEQVKEEIKLDPSFRNYRVDSEQNRKINEIAEGLKSGKIIGKKIISNAFDLNASYCFTPNLEDKTINDLNLQDLLGKLKTQAFPLSDIITNAINQKERVALDYALINDIKYNLLDNTFHFIFDIGNPLLKESSQLVIEAPREALDLENVDLISHISEGSYIIDQHLIDD
ncbi:hypothetical protein E5L34_03265 [Helicobacter pylori]|nr:hypothetical protein E5L34_03265 [Helicobacter pylori]